MDNAKLESERRSRCVGDSQFFANLDSSDSFIWLSFHFYTKIKIGRASPKPL